MHHSGEGASGEFMGSLLGVEPGRDGAFSYLVGVWGDNQFGQSIRYDN